MNSRYPARLPGFPRCRLLALVDTDADLQATLAALARQVDPTTIGTLSGERGAVALDVSGAAGGTWGRPRRVLHNVAFHRDSLAWHEAHLTQGGHLLVIPARDWARCERLVQVLADHGAHGLVWFARFTVVDVTPRRRAVATPAILVGAAEVCDRVGREPALVRIAL